MYLAPRDVRVPIGEGPDLFVFLLLSEKSCKGAGLNNPGARRYNICMTSTAMQGVGVAFNFCLLWSCASTSEYFSLHKENEGKLRVREGLLICATEIE